jgi:hypothetical protein
MTNEPVPTQGAALAALEELKQVVLDPLNTLTSAQKEPGSRPPLKLRVGPGVHPLFANTFSVWKRDGVLRLLACDSASEGLTSPVHTFLVMTEADAVALCRLILNLPEEKTDGSER